MGRLGLCLTGLIIIWSAVCHSEEAEIVNFNQQLESVLAAKRFNDLEIMANDFRQKDSRFRGGNAKIYHFYRALGGVSTYVSLGGERNSPFYKKQQLIGMWVSNQPSSLTARLAMAQLWLGYAFHWRGDRYADQVTDKQWKLFREGLDKAASYLTDIDPDKDPHAYLVLMELAKGKQYPRPALDAMYEAAVKRYPMYFHYYSLRANDLQKRWYGRDGELSDYLQSVLKVPGGDDGKVAYSYISYSLMQLYPGEELYKRTGLTWPQVKVAYATRERRYGLRIKDWNALCYLAMAGNDRKAAMEALKHVGGDWSPQIWEEKKYFDAAVAWAQAKPN